MKIRNALAIILAISCGQLYSANLPQYEAVHVTVMNEYADPIKVTKSFHRTDQGETSIPAGSSQEFTLIAGGGVYLDSSEFPILHLTKEGSDQRIDTYIPSGQTENVWLVVKEKDGRLIMQKRKAPPMIKSAGKQ